MYKILWLISGQSKEKARASVLDFNKLTPYCDVQVYLLLGGAQIYQEYSKGHGKCMYMYMNNAYIYNIYGCIYGFRFFWMKLNFWFCYSLWESSYERRRNYSYYRASLKNKKKNRFSFQLIWPSGSCFLCLWPGTSLGHSDLQGPDMSIKGMWSLCWLNNKKNMKK